MRRKLSFLFILIGLSLVAIESGNSRPQTLKNIQGRWHVTFKMAGLTKNVIFEATDNGSGSFKLLDTAMDDKPVRKQIPAIWTQLSNDRVSFAGDAELPIGTCCREMGTMVFKGRFKTNDAIEGTLVFITSVDQEESPFKFRSEVGTFTANRVHT